MDYRDPQEMLKNTDRRQLKQVGQRAAELLGDDAERFKQKYGNPADLQKLLQALTPQDMAVIGQALQNADRLEAILSDPAVGTRLRQLLDAR